MTDRYPNFFIVGAAKSGTTSLYEYLRTSSGVYMCPVKEPHFFSPDAVKNVGTPQRVVDWDAYTPVRALARRCLPAGLRVWIRDTVLLKRATKPSMSSEARVFLEEYYGADMRRLESLLGRRLPWRWLNA